MPKILTLYHYYHPDDVVSALQFTGLSEGLVEKGFEVETWPCNRSCHHPKAKYSMKVEMCKGVKVRRIWRPDFNQHKFLGRILNALWVIGTWKFRVWTNKAPDIVIVGTDPIFAVLLTILFRLRWPKTKIAHWCFDMYPEYAIADGIVSENSFLVKFLRFLLKEAYGKCDLVADLGPCMGTALGRYPIKKLTTLTPWALEEPLAPLPIDESEIRELFGDSQLGVLYSGNFSRPHSYILTLALANKMRGNAAPIVGASAGSGSTARHNQDLPSGLRAGGQVSVTFTYSARGSRMEELKKVLMPEDTNIRFAGFAPAARLAARLSAPDIHLVSLGPVWMGLVVPSKFFGALAAGRPVLFEGDERSSIAQWIKEYQVGWVLKPGNLEEVAADLLRFSKDQNEKTQMFRHCHQIYQANFSKAAVISRWDTELRTLLS